MESLTPVQAYLPYLKLVLANNRTVSCSFPQQLFYNKIPLFCCGYPFVC